MGGWNGAVMEKKEKIRYDSLDGIRGIAAVIIAYFAHYNNSFGGNRPLARFLDSTFIDSLHGNGAQVWVEMFFCLSGFVIFQAYFDRIIDETQPLLFKDYLYKRVIRIFPLFWLTTLVAWGLQWFNLFTTGENFLMGENDLHHLFLSIFGLHNISGVVTAPSFNSPAWFLSSVMVCYVIFYVLARVLKKNFIYGCVGMVIFGTIVVHSYLLADIPFIGLSMGRGYLAFFWGVLLAMFVRHHEGKSRIIPLVIGGVLLFLWLWCFYFREGLLGDFYTTATFYACTGIVFIAIYSNIIRKILCLKLFQVLGKISFSIYLWNFPTDIVFGMIQRYFDCFDYASVRFWGLHLIVSLALAVLSNYVIEPAFTKQVKKLLKNL